MENAAEIIARELSLPLSGVARVTELLSEGNSVPFLARYRKEATGGLDEVQIRAIEERQSYLKELDERRSAIIKAIEEQGQMTEALRRTLEASTLKSQLEDLYLPFKKKRRTRATTARERGLEPLAQAILSQPRAGSPHADALRFVDAGREVPDVESALQGARDIVAEILSEDAQIRASVRDALARQGQIVCQSVKKKKDEEDAARFRDYFEHDEPIRAVPSHRYLAMARGEREGFLKVKLEVDTDRLKPRLLRIAGHAPGSPWAGQLEEALDDALGRLIGPSVGSDVRGDLKERADGAAIEVFAENLRNLLLAAPGGSKAVIGVDPGLRTGCKCAALDETGNFVETRTLYLVQGEGSQARAAQDLVQMVKRHRPFAVAIGNGTGGRETLAFVKEALKAAGEGEVAVVSVSESGASVYSASDVAREEFPELDLTIRGAISIGRRLQDPLAELVKLDPKVIGVGQYQHDVHQGQLQKKLSEVVEDCVNSVGVSINTASAHLLAYVSGIGPQLARKIVEHRAASGPFESRKALMKVSGLGPKTFEQAAGFLRIRGGHPLDASAVHPERYGLVERMAKDAGLTVNQLVGDAIKADRIDLRRYADDKVGEPTLRDIVRELKKPGLDPRATFEPPRFRDDVHDIKDLKAGMALDGVVTNVTAFGAFVDLCVHRDGLVHISQLADRFVRDPHEVVQVGQAIRVRVLEVDLKRRRISLTARKDNPGGQP